MPCAKTDRHGAHGHAQAGQVALNTRQHGLLSEAASALGAIRPNGDLLLTAEELRAARSAFDRLLGGAGTEDMLDALFGRFCIGK
jgi:tRNA modification GTPase